jgi:hypothetical protein
MPLPAGGFFKRKHLNASEDFAGQKKPKIQCSSG